MNKSLKEQEKELKRMHIVTAAESVFSQNGFTGGATMNDIAKKAEFTKRTVYAYFDKKEEIIYEVMYKGFKKLNKLLVETKNGLGNKEVKKTVRGIGLYL